MKKVNLNGKLSFNKETIAKLNNEQMNVVKGGLTLPHCANTGVSICKCVIPPPTKQ